MASGSIPADFKYQLNVIVMQLVQEEDLVELLLWYHVTSDVALVNLLLWYHAMSVVSLVDFLLWYDVSQE
jgi:hypothetical protein